MYILAIETTGPLCSVALIDEHGSVKEKISEGTLKHLQNLSPMMHATLNENIAGESHAVGRVDEPGNHTYDAYSISAGGVSMFDEVSDIAVSVGPGSFTGIRIGVATARALSQILDKKLISVPTLEAFGLYELEELSETVSAEDVIVCPVFDARRGGIYGGAYRKKTGEPTVGDINGTNLSVGDAYENSEEIIAAGPYDIDSFLGKLSDGSRARFIGDGVVHYGEQIDIWAKEHHVEISFSTKTQHAAGVARFAQHMKVHQYQFKGRTEMDYEELEPVYMRKAEAERKFEEKKAAERARKYEDKKTAEKN